MSTKVLSAGAAYLESLLGLSGRTAVVTGGSSGIGREMATALSMAGASVIIVARRTEPIQETVNHIKKAGGRAFGLPIDVRDADAINDAVVQNHGVPDILVNAAGINPRPPMDNISLEDWEETLAINLTAPFTLGQKFGPAMAERGSGRIINIGSTNADRMPFAGGGVYAMSKSALVGLTKGLARDLGPRGITVNNVQPGPVDTDMNPADSDFATSLMGLMAVPRYGKATEIAAMVAYLAGPEAGYVTGASLTIDGGFGA